MNIAMQKNTTPIPIKEKQAVMYVYIKFVQELLHMLYNIDISMHIKISKAVVVSVFSFLHFANISRKCFWGNIHF